MSSRQWSVQGGPGFRGRSPSRVGIGSIAALLALASFVAGCADDPASVPTPSGSPGTSERPREVAIIARDYRFEPPTLLVTPGETLLVHVVNGGLALHEVVIGDMRVQEAWEAAEAVTIDAPPGATPVVSVPPDVAGIRAVVRSGERVDVSWTVPADPAAVAGLIVGCHIPGHWAKGMQVPVAIRG